MVHVTRRGLLHTGVAALAAPVLGALDSSLSGARAQAASSAPQPGGEAADRWRHALSLFGEPKYPAGFKHFDYVNADAPKAGALRQMAIGTFDNLNFVVAGVKGTVAGPVLLIYDTLAANAFDEVGSAYGLVAEAVRYPADWSSATYRLRREARWHDGEPITPDDVIFSFDALKANSPMRAAYYRHVVKAEKTGEREVTFTFDQAGNRELPQIVGELQVLPKHWWEGTDASGKKRDIAATTLEKPLASGPYRIKDVSPGRTIVLERVKDYWAKDLPVSVGINNFDTVRYDYFRDTTVALQAFKADAVDWREENSAKDWATAYDFPAVSDKRVVLEEFPVRDRGVMQAFIPNSRRAKFSDPRVRHALNFAFDFETMNKQLFYGQYQRIDSYFSGTELACSGLPQGKELAFLEPLRDQLPPEVFTTAYSNPVTGSDEAVRKNLRESFRLLREAGYDVKDRKMVNTKTGEPFTIEFLIADPSSERIVLGYIPSLKRLGIAATTRMVDDAQYINRRRSWDFDIIIGSWAESLSPGNEQRAYWSSQSADTAGSPNYAGIKNPAVDALIEKVIYATDRDSLVAATRALDRTLLWNHYVVPQWTYNKARTARWDRFSHPQTMPKYGEAAFPLVWWWDKEKAAKVQQRS